MINKHIYIDKFKKIYQRKNNAEISDDQALEYFEKLVVLVAAITGHISLQEIIFLKHGEGYKTK